MIDGKSKKEDIEDLDFQPPKKKRKVDYHDREEALSKMRKLYIPKKHFNKKYNNINRYKKKRYVDGPLKKCVDLLKKLMKNDNAAPFKFPVDKIVVPDYYFIVKKPMDFDTILNNLNNKKYSRVEEFRDDIYLVFSNCYLYNPSGSLFRIMSDKLKREFDKGFSEIFEDSELILNDKGVGGKKRTAPKKQTEKKKKIVSRTKPRIIKSNFKRKPKKRRAPVKTKRSRKRRPKKKKKRTPKVNFKQKQMMVKLIPTLNETNQSKIIEMVKHYREDGDETVTIDLDSYNNDTLFKLYKFCEKLKKDSVSESDYSSSEEEEEEFFYYDDDDDY